MSEHFNDEQDMTLVNSASEKDAMGEEISSDHASVAGETVASPMTEKIKKKREPFFHIVKRDSITKKGAWGIRALAIIIALVVCAIVTVIMTGDNPFSIYASMFKGAFGSPRRFLMMMQNLAMLLCISLAVTPAFKMRFWNIGAEGQVLVGGLATAACMFYLGGKVPEGLLIVFMFLSALVAGAVWGVIPAIFKAKWNTNETLFTLMLNYVAMQLIQFFIMIWDKSGSAVVGPSKLPHGWLPDLFGQKYVLNILIVACLTGIVYVYLKYSKHGYEISVVGESENTARYVGINVKKVIVRTMAISGMICGLAGFLLVAGADHSIAKDTAGGMGFDAIMVSWLAKFNPIYMVMTSFLLVFLETGAQEVSTMFRLNSAFSEILTGVILFFIIGCEFFIQYQVKFCVSKKEVA